MILLCAFVGIAIYLSNEYDIRVYCVLRRNRGRKGSRTDILFVMCHRDQALLCMHISTFMVQQSFCTHTRMTIFVYL